MATDQEVEERVRQLIDYGGGPRGSADFLITEATQLPPSRFMRFVPDEVQQVLRAVSANPPASIADFDWIESSNYRAEFFRGLNDDQIDQKIKADEDARKQRWLEGLRAVHRYFSDRQAKDVDELCSALDALKSNEARAPLLIRLLELSGHERHEDIVFELGLLGEPTAVPAILRASLQPFPYIDEWGNLHEFQRKCAYALARIGTNESRIALEQLAGHSEPRLREYGEEGLSEWPLPFKPR